MTEKQTPQPDHEPKEGASVDESHLKDADFEEIYRFMDEHAGEAASRIVSFKEPASEAGNHTAAPRPKRVVYIPEPKSEKEKSKEVSPRVRRNRKIAGAAGIVLTGLAGAGIMHELAEVTKDTQFSTATTVYTVQPGEGIMAAAEHIKGIQEHGDLRDAVTYIQNDPANIDVLRDGLQPNEQLVIPMSVKGYEDKK